MAHETEEDYVWALEQMKKCFGERLRGQIVVVTDWELALMHGIASILPQATNILCMWHIDKNVLANLKKHFATNEAWQGFFSKWHNMCNSVTQQDFTE
jgi:MULE transposase domain